MVLRHIGGKGHSTLGLNHGIVQVVALERPIDLFSGSGRQTPAHRAASRHPARVFAKLGVGSVNRLVGFFKAIRALQGNHQQLAVIFIFRREAHGLDSPLGGSGEITPVKILVGLRGDLPTRRVGVLLRRSGHAQLAFDGVAQGVEPIVSPETFDCFSHRLVGLLKLSLGKQGVGVRLPHATVTRVELQGVIGQRGGGCCIARFDQVVNFLRRCSG